MCANKSRSVDKDCTLLCDTCSSVEDDPEAKVGQDEQGDLGDESAYFSPSVDELGVGISTGSPLLR
jgi:hypothetical protein